MPRITVILSIAFCCCTAYTETIALPGDADSLEEALDVARAGDVVTLAKGRYYGPVYLPGGVTIEGAGSDVVNIRCRGASGPVIYVEDCDSGAIAGVTIEHTSTQWMDFNDRYDTPALKIVDSTIEVRDCVVQNSAGDGIHIEGDSETRVENTKCTGNYWDGIFVTGVGAMPVILNNECVDNGDDGIHIAEGAEGEYRGNDCSSNITDGIAITQSHSNPTLESNTCTNNGNSGIRFIDGADGTVSSSECSDNEYFGIEAAGYHSQLTITGVTVQENGEDGIYINGGSTAGISDCTLVDNVEAGIYAVSFGTTITIEDCQFESNGTHGIYTAGGADITGENNTYIGGDLASVYIRDPGTRYVSENDTFEKLAKEPEEARAHPTSTWIVDDGYVWHCLLSREFEDLHALYDYVREVGGHDENSGHNISAFDYGIRDTMKMEDIDQQLGVGFFDDWREAYPDSPLPAIAEAWKLSNEAMHIAGATSQKLEDEAMDLATRAIEMDPGNAAAYHCALSISSIIDRDMEEVRGYYEKGIEVDPDYFPLIATMAWVLSPDRGEDIETFKTFLKEATADHPSGPDAVYARVVTSFCGYGSPQYVRNLEFDYQRAMHGFETLLIEYPDSDYLLNAMAYLACINEDRERAAAIFEDIGDDYDLTFWDDEYNYYDWRDWAVEGGPLPGTPFSVFNDFGLSPSMVPILLLGFAGVCFLLFVAMCTIVVVLMRRAA